MTSAAPFTIARRADNGLSTAERATFTYDGSLLKTDTRTGVMSGTLSYAYSRRQRHQDRRAEGRRARLHVQARHERPNEASDAEAHASRKAHCRFPLCMKPHAMRLMRPP